MNSPYLILSEKRYSTSRKPEAEPSEKDVWMGWTSRIPAEAWEP